MDRRSSPNDTEPLEPSRKKTRGRNRCLSLLKLSAGEKLPITYDDRGQPIGPNAAILASFCGILARDGDIFPLDISSWREMGEDTKDHAWLDVQDAFEIDPSMRDFVLRSLNKKWKDYKSDLKRTFYNDITDPIKRYASRPSDVKEDQWRSLIQFWDSEEGKKRSQTNKANRSHQTMLHTSGTKSFSRLRAEEKAKCSTQTALGRAEIFVKTHVRKNGSPVDELASQKIAQMQAALEKLPESTQDSIARCDIYSQVMGPERHGRIRGCGLGHTPTRLWGPSSSRSQEIASLKERLRSLEEREANRDAEMLELRRMVQLLSKQYSIPTTQPGDPVVPMTPSSEGDGITNLDQTQ